MPISVNKAHMNHLHALLPTQLYRRCPLEQLTFNTTQELPDLDEPLGQERAASAIHFGVSMRRKGYNLFVLGPTGGGRHSLVQKLVKSIAADMPAPGDWCYLHNFDNPQKPFAINMAAGTARQLKNDLKHMIDDIATAIPAAFASKVFTAQEKEIEERYRNRQDEAFRALEEEALRHHIAFARTDNGFAFAPLRAGHILRPEEFTKLDHAQQEKYGQAIEMLQNKLHELLDEIPKWQQEMRANIRELITKTTRLAVSPLAMRVHDNYAALPAIQHHIEKISQNIVENIELFRAQDSPDSLFPLTPGTLPGLLRHYQINVLVDHADTRGAPVVYSSNPTHDNLLGKTEYLAHMGTMITDFMLIRSGAFHQANGGFLIIDAHKILAQPYAWDALKRTLMENKVTIESLAETLGLIHTVTLEPETISIDLKVILLGERFVYYLLCELDPDFAKLFKVAADFDEEIERNDSNSMKLACLIATQVRADNMRSFDKTAVARVIEHCARMVEHADKLSVHLGHITDLLHESDYWAGVDGRATVTANDVEKAIAQQYYRTDRVRHKLLEHVIEGSTLIDTSGMRVGQINGLSVINLGHRWYGMPSRITATARPGEGKLIDIEREAELGGEIHTKSVIILTHYLASRYARTKPLSLMASVGFEQSYGEVEGDSASVAELLALLSAISNIPLKQNLAVTGSLNQLGEIQVIGGVNEKIEGFFDICAERGLTGDQGVVIPAANAKHLMLKKEIVEAATEGKFHIYAVNHIDDAIELFSGMPAGERGDDGQLPENTFNYAVELQLLVMAELVQPPEHFPPHGQDIPAGGATALLEQAPEN